MVLCLARLWGIPEIGHAQSFAALEASFQAVCLRRSKRQKRAELVRIVLGTPGISTEEAKRALDESNTKRGEGRPTKLSSMPSLLISLPKASLLLTNYRKTESLDDGVGAEHLHFAQLQAQAIERRLHVDILVGSFEIDEDM